MTLDHEPSVGSQDDLLSRGEDSGYMDTKRMTRNYKFCCSQFRAFFRCAVDRPGRVNWDACCLRTIGGIVQILV